MKATEQYFLVVLFIMLYKVVVLKCPREVPHGGTAQFQHFSTKCRDISNLNFHAAWGKKNKFFNCIR